MACQADRHVSESEQETRSDRLTPKIATLMWPPRIIAKDSLESTHDVGHGDHAVQTYAPKTDAPGTRVTVSFPALMRSLHIVINNLNTRMPSIQSHLRVDLFLCRVGTQSKDTVLALQPNVYTFRQVFRYKCWHADTKIDVESIPNLFSGTLCNLVSLSRRSSFLGAQRFAPSC